MAFVSLVPSTNNSATFYKNSDGLTQLRIGPVKDASGTVVDLSGWNQITANFAYFPNGGGGGSGVLALNPVGNADGTLTQILDPNDDTVSAASAANVGTAAIYFLGTKAAGDTPQLIGRISVQIQTV